MTSESEYKLKGINSWFVIEILSFYGYITSAIAFILFHGLSSSIWNKKYKCHEERYKYDFLAYHKKDLDWLAFVFILFSVNIMLLCIDDYVIFNTPEKRQGHTFPLRSLMQ